MDNNKTARLAGFLYLVIIITGIFDLKVIPDRLIVNGNAVATYANIVRSETLFRLGIATGLVSNILWLLLPLVLYKLLRPVNQTYALLMVILAELIVPISFVNILNKFDVLTVIGNAGLIRTFGIEKLQAQVLLYLQFYDNGNQIAEIFWGLWLLPFGYLVYRSGFLPRILGMVLMLGCIGYLVDFVGDFFFKGYENTGISFYATLPAGLGELAICLWMLILGVKKINRPSSP
jgi:uncharacterized protein DUF4386